MTAILVAEDDPDICELLAEVLETELGALVRCEGRGSLALRVIETAGFDLAIIDVDLPEISGYVLAKRAVDRHIPVLLSSSYPDAAAKLRKYGFPYLAKPYRLTELVFEAAKSITHTEKNIRCTKASFATLETTDDLKDILSRSGRLINESIALLPGRMLPERAIPSDVIDEWLLRLAPRSKRETTMA